MQPGGTRGILVHMLSIDAPRRRLLASEVLRMVEDGILRPDEPLELIDGELIVVSPQGPQHSSRVMKLHALLMEAYRGTGHVRVQMPVDAGPDSMPEPDLAVVYGGPERYELQHPGGADGVLLIEVAYSSQKLDRAKGPVYARAGFEHYWLVDLSSLQVEVSEGPAAGGYQRTRVFGAGQRVTLPGTAVEVSVASLAG